MSYFVTLDPLAAAAAAAAGFLSLVISGLKNPEFLKCFFVRTHILKHAVIVVTIRPMFAYKRSFLERNKTRRYMRSVIWCAGSSSQLGERSTNASRALLKLPRRTVSSS